MKFTWMNCKYIAIERTIKVAISTINKSFSAYLMAVWLCKESNQTLPSKILRYMSGKWRNAIFRPIKHNPERNATIIITVFFSIFLIASRIISPPPCFCLLLSHHCSNARKKKEYVDFSIFLLCSHLFSLLKFRCLFSLVLTEHTWNFLYWWRNHKQFQWISNEAYT